jgi:hypothetical protein
MTHYPQTFYVDDIENRVLSALRAEMKSPAAIAEYVKTYMEEGQRLSAKIEKKARQPNGVLASYAAH